nr:MAG TPA: hypothetical protein [Caudoviricetes sp.]
MTLADNGRASKYLYHLSSIRWQHRVLFLLR